ncbi:MAG: hypothetical protein ACR2FH_04365 [Caulobacteraceae bacterium]
MEILRALGAEIFMMFAADLWLTVTALAAVALAALALRGHLLAPSLLPFALAGGVLVALAVGVVRGARR